MKKIILLLSFFFIFMINSLSNAWDAKDQTSVISNCINENLDPCVTQDTLSKKTVSKKDIKKKKVNKKEKKIVKTKDIKKKKVNKKNKKIYKKKLFKKKNKDNSLLASSSKINKNSDFNKNTSFDEFKKLLINYTNNSDYPNIDN